jgi:hypothetical protein
MERRIALTKGTKMRRKELGDEGGANEFTITSIKCKVILMTVLWNIGEALGGEGEGDHDLVLWATGHLLRDIRSIADRRL